MTIIPVWVQPSTLLRIECQARLTLEEINETSQHILQYAEASPLYILIELGSDVVLPRNLINLYYGECTFRELVQHPNTKTVAFAGADPLVQNTLRTIMHRQRYRLVATQAQGLNYLREEIDKDHSDN